MYKLTDEIKQQVTRGWRIGLQKEKGILVYDVFTRIGSKVIGDEVWFIHSKSSGERGGYAPMDSRCFVEVNLNDVCYCYHQRMGSIYLDERLMDDFDV